ncbi:hypothetical protein DITRI_Ditri07aG0147100 [Diplodiscus trichospermus]
MPPEKLEIFNSVDKNQRPQYFLPTSESQEGFYEQVKELRERSKEIPDEYLVVLAGNIITEGALSQLTKQYCLTHLMELEMRLGCAKLENNPYKGLIYTSYQERATLIRLPWQHSQASQGTWGHKIVTDIWHRGFR